MISDALDALSLRWARDSAVPLRFLYPQLDVLLLAAFDHLAEYEDIRQ